jgi:hypothetical protein
MNMGKWVLGIAGLLALSGVLALHADDAAPGEDAVAADAPQSTVEFINSQIRIGWEDNEVTPSAPADDAEWLRRVYLDIVGHIPPADVVDAFIANEEPDKRIKLISQLLDDPGYVRNFTAIWTNILLGRNTPDRTNRPAFEKFLREAFARDRPWNEVVFDMLTAEGHFEENGAVNYLLGQLQGNPGDPEYHVEVTARTARVFLGMQVQCTQCHNHPFNEWKQNQFWEFNSFMRQVRRNDVDRYNPATGQDEDDYSELVWMDFEGPVYYETRQGVMQVAYPTYFSETVDAELGSDRRRAFAELVCHTDIDHQLARAMVNRMWGHFMGYGFTRPIDDMGPHNVPSHPEVLERLTEEFVASKYNIKELIRTICQTEAYHLTSQFNETNQIDNPAAGEVPLFSHMYVKTLQAEQLYDSLIVATNAHQSGQAGYEQAEEQRAMWMQEYLRIFGGNADSEPTLFSGSIPQALLMMNGELVQQAISAERGSYLNTVLADPRYRNDAARIQALFVSALGRLPTRNEANTFTQGLRGVADPLAAYQDLYWALLNSNEFILNH